MIRIITLPSGRDVRLSTYCASWRKLKHLPASRDVANWGHFPTRVDEILGSIRYGVHDRINRHIPGFASGRKWDPDWQRAVGYSARLLNTPRLIIDWLPPDLTARFSHRLRRHHL